MEPIPKYRDNIGYPRYGESWLSGITNMVKTPAIYRLSPIYHFWHFWCDFCNFCVFFAFFCIFWVHFFVFNNEDFWCAFIFDFLCFILFFLCTFFAIFASADRRRKYIRYRDNIGYPRHGERYNIGDNQYSSKNLSYCPINRFLGSVTSLSAGAVAIGAGARKQAPNFSFLHVCKIPNS